MPIRVNILRNKNLRLIVRTDIHVCKLFGLVWFFLSHGIHGFMVIGDDLMIGDDMMIW